MPAEWTEGAKSHRGRKTLRTNWERERNHHEWRTWHKWQNIKPTNGNGNWQLSFRAAVPRNRRPQPPAWPAPNPMPFTPSPVRPPLHFWGHLGICAIHRHKRRPMEKRPQNQWRRGRRGEKKSGDGSAGRSQVRIVCQSFFSSPGPFVLALLVTVALPHLLFATSAHHLPLPQGVSVSVLSGNCVCSVSIESTPSPPSPCACRKMIFQIYKQRRPKKGRFKYERGLFSDIFDKVNK